MNRIINCKIVTKQSKNTFHKLSVGMTDKRERDGQAFTICNDSRSVGLLDSAPVVFLAGAKPEHATPVTLV